MCNKGISFLSPVCPCMISLIALKKTKEKAKSKKNQNAFTWLQAYFLGDVKVIWCNSLGDSHFQTYVIDDVEIVLNYYLHITFYVSHIFTSCTHHK